MTRLLSAAGLLGLVLAAPAPARAQRAAPAPLTGKEIYQRTLKSTVWVIRGEGVEVEDGRRGVRIAMGSGSLIDVPSRLVLTNYHVVRDKDVAMVFFPSFDKQGHLVAERDHYLNLL